MTPMHYRVLFLEVGVLLLLATAKLPYDFYKPLRLTVAAASVFLIFRAKKLKQPLWIVPAAIAILLFTPNFGFTFPKEIWAPIDVAFGVFFFAAAIVTGRPYKVQESDDSGAEGHPQEEAIPGQSGLELEFNDGYRFWAFVSVSTVLALIFATFW